MIKEEASAMPPPSNPSWTTGSGTSGYRRFRYGGNDLRASDAERAEVADRLSKHYQEGRLDQAEFNERLDRAMSAKTRADFNGLFADLPDVSEPAGPQQQNGQPAGKPIRMSRRPQSGSSLVRILAIVVLAIVAIMIAHSVMHSVLLWVLVGVVAFIWLRNEEQRRRR